MITLSLTPQEIQIIVNCIDATDPLKIFTGDLSKRIANESNEQIKKQELENNKTETWE